MLAMFQAKEGKTGNEERLGVGGAEAGEDGVDASEESGDSAQD